jgi:hypothetical protein
MSAARTASSVRSICGLLFTALTNEARSLYCTLKMPQRSISALILEAPGALISCSIKLHNLSLNTTAPSCGGGWTSHSKPCMSVRGMLKVCAAAAGVPQSKNMQEAL